MFCLCCCAACTWGKCLFSRKTNNYYWKQLQSQHEVNFILILLLIFWWKIQSNGPKKQFLTRYWLLRVALVFRSQCLCSVLSTTHETFLLKKKKNQCFLWIFYNFLVVWWAGSEPLAGRFCFLVHGWALSFTPLAEGSRFDPGQKMS